jgi:hypothetical protein
MVPIKRLTKEFLAVNFREMISWKWSLDWDPASYRQVTMRWLLNRTVFRGFEEREFNKLLEEGVRQVWPCRRVNYFEGLYLGRRFGDRFSPANAARQERAEEKERRGRYFRPWSKAEKEVPVFDSVLATQDTGPLEGTFLPPPYDLEPTMLSVAEWNDALDCAMSRHGTRALPYGSDETVYAAIVGL